MDIIPIPHGPNFDGSFKFRFPEWTFFSWGKVDKLVPPPPPSISQYQVGMGIGFGIGIAIVVGVGAFLYWTFRRNSETIQDLLNQIEALKTQNAQLKARTRVNVKENRDLHEMLEEIQDEKEEMTDRILDLEHRTVSLLESITSNNNDAKVQIMKDIYKEQIETLRKENESLMKKYEKLRASLECAICLNAEANSVLRPCGHTMCSACYTQIEKQWVHSPEWNGSVGPTCPFCRREVIEVIPKYGCR